MTKKLMYANYDIIQLVCIPSFKPNQVYSYGFLFNCTTVGQNFDTAAYTKSTNYYPILVGKRELVALLYLSSWCLLVVERLFLAVPRGCLQFLIVVFPDHTHLLFLV